MRAFLFSIACAALTLPVSAQVEPKFQKDAAGSKDHPLAEGTVLARVDVLETKAMANRMVVVKADEMQQQIDKSGRVALYGILFDSPDFFISVGPRMPCCLKPRSRRYSRGVIGYGPANSI